MSEIESPSGLDLNPRPPSVVRLSKRAGIIAVIVLTLVLGLVGYGVATRRQRSVELMRGNRTKDLTAATEAGRAVASQIPASLLAAPAPKATPEVKQTGLRSGHAAAPRPQPVPPASPLRDLSPEEKRREAAYRLELEAMAAPTAARGGFGSPSVAPGLAAAPSREGDLAQLGHALAALRPGAVRAHGPRTDTRPVLDDEDYIAQNMQAEKEAFLAKARAGATDEDYLKSTRRAPLGKYEIKAGWDIPAVLEQALNSDLPGEIRALVRENVYDTATGNYLLIPQGSRLVGVYDARISYGQNGVTVAWNRIIFPDASSLNLAGMAGQDARGQTGLRHDVDNHYRRLVGFAVLTSMFSAAFQLSQSRREGVLGYPSAGETAGSAVGRELSQLGAQVTRRNLNIQPTIKVPVGYRFNVRVNRDLLFEAPYQPLPE